MSGNTQPKILLVNDDGFRSPYLERFALSLTEVATVYVVAPETEQSGVSHAFCGFLGHSLRKIAGKEPLEFYALSGSPADCAKFAIKKLFRDEKIDCVFSGPNKGENAGVSSLYSGTVAGAREAALWGIPAIAVSFALNSDFQISEKMEKEAARFAKTILQSKLYEKIPAHTFWNVNYPDDKIPFAGYRVARQNVSMFTDYYVEKEGKYFLEGYKVPETFAEKSDDLVLSQGYASITPMTVDQTLESDLTPLDREIQKFFLR